MQSLDCSQALAASLGCPAHFYRNWRALFPSFGAFARFLSINYHALRFICVGGSLFLEGPGDYVNVFCFEAFEDNVFHVDSNPSSFFNPLPIARLHSLMSSLQVYAQPNQALLPIPLNPQPARGRGRGRSNNPRQNHPAQTAQTGRGGRGRRQGQGDPHPNPRGRSAQSGSRGRGRGNRGPRSNGNPPPAQTGNNNNNPPNNNNQPAGNPPPAPAQPAAPVVPAPPVNSTYDWWYKLVCSFNVTPGSLNANKFLEENGFAKKLNAVVSHAHPMSRAARHLMHVRLLAHFFHEFAIGNPLYWVAPTNSLINFADRVLNERSTAIATLAQAARFQNGPNPHTFNTINVAPNGVQRVRCIVCDTFDRDFDDYAVDSLFAFRMWRSNSRASIDDEVTVDPFSPEDFPLRNNAPYPPLPQWFTPYEDEMLHIQVVGSGAFVEPGDLLFHMSTHYATNNEALRFLVTPSKVGDYGLYQLVINGQNGCVTDTFSTVILPQTKTVTYPHLPEVLWDLCGDSAVNLVPDGWFVRTEEVVCLSVPIAQNGHFGGPFSTGAIAKAIDSHPIIKDHRRPAKIRNKILVSSVAYHAHQTATTSRSIAVDCARAGTSTGTLDDNRNYFALGSYLGCCGQRVKFSKN